MAFYSKRNTDPHGEVKFSKNVAFLSHPSLDASFSHRLQLQPVSDYLNILNDQVIQQWIFLFFDGGHYMVAMPGLLGSNCKRVNQGA